MREIKIHHLDGSIEYDRTLNQYSCVTNIGFYYLSEISKKEVLIHPKNVAKIEIDPS